MSKSNWIVLKTKNYGSNHLEDTPYNTDFILFARPWYHEGGKVDERSVKIQIVHRMASIRAFDITLIELAARPGFLMLNEQVKNPDNKFINSKIVVNKKNITDYRPYNPPAGKEDGDKKWVVYMASVENSQPKQIITSDDLPLIFSESVSG